jgi:hypothetical protein
MAAEGLITERGPGRVLIFSGVRKYFNIWLAGAFLVAVDAAPVIVTDHHLMDAWLQTPRPLHSQEFVYVGHSSPLLRKKDLRL